MVAVLALTLVSSACLKTQSKSNTDKPCANRYLPVGDNPDVALDTQTGMLCRTFDDTTAPSGFRDPACGVTGDQKERSFVPYTCKTGQTWVQIDQHSPRFTSVPACNKH
jgi:glucose dehydrogenase